MATFAHDLGLEYMQATNLAQAKTLYNSHTPQIILLPITVNGEQTLDFTRTCLLANPQTQVIVIVNRNQINEAAEAMRLGVSDCLFKPFSQERLLKTLSVAVKRVGGEQISIPLNAPKISLHTGGASVTVEDPDAPVSEVLSGGDNSQNPSLLSHFRGLSLAQIERVIIEEMILAEDGSIPRAATILKVAPSTLYRKVEAWKKQS